MLPSRCTVVSIGNPRSYCGVIYLDKKYCRLAELVSGQVNDLRHCRNATMPYLTLDSGLLCIPTPHNKKKAKNKHRRHISIYILQEILNKMSTIPGTSSYPRAKSQKSEEGPSDVDIRLNENRKYLVQYKKGEIQVGSLKSF